MSYRTRLSAGHGLGALLVVAAGLVLLAGCGSGPRRHHVSGQVMYDGKPVPAGEIYFDPDITKGHDGPQGFARIRDGRYDTRQGGLPVASGPYVVRVLGFDGRSGPDLPFGKSLFPDYKTPADMPDRGNATLDLQVPAKGQRR